MTEARSPWRAVWRGFNRHKGARLGLIVLAALILFVLIGPALRAAPDMTVAQQIRLRNLPPGAAYPFGTDQLGRDLLLRMMQGGRISLSVGLMAMAISVVLGSGIGLVSGYVRRLDGPLMRLTDLFLALPLLPLLLLMVMLFREPLSRQFGPEGGIFLLMVGAIGLTSWMQVARIVRSAVLSLKARDFVRAALALGTPSGQVILRHVLPNVMSPILIAASLGLASAILTESALSFLGLGFPPDFPTWGRLLFDGVAQMQLYPTRVLWPGLAISLTVLSVHYMAEGLRAALDPRNRGQ